MGGTNNPVDKVGETVVKESSGFLGSLMKIPMAIINGVSGLGKGAFNNTVGNLWGMLTTSGIFALLVKFAPSFVAWIPIKIGDKTVGQMIADDIDPVTGGGNVALMKDSVLAAAVINAITGGVSGMVGEVVGTATDKDSPEAPSTLSKVAGFAGGALLIAGVASIFVGAVHKNGITYNNGNDDPNATKNPLVTPPVKPGAATGVTPA